VQTTEELIVSLTQELVKRSKPCGDDNGAQSLIAERLKKIGFVVQNVDLPNCPNLLALRGADSGGQANLFAFSGHTDVVPAGSGWSVDPFQGVVVGSRLLGRGVADMKGAVAAWIVALEELFREKPHLSLPIAILLAGDEETFSKGTPALLNELKARGLKIRSCIVGEPSSTLKVGDCIRIGRRGSLSAQVVIKGVQGHVAYPQLARNPIHAAAAILNQLLSTDLDLGLEIGPKIAATDDGWPKSSLQLSEFQSGVGGATNVIPGEALFRFNIRYRPPLNREGLIEMLAPLMTEPGFSVEVEWSVGSKPYDSKPKGLTSAVLKLFNERGVTTTISRDGGTSDGRFVAETGAEVVELGPSNETIHKVDEGLEISQLVELVYVYRELIEAIAAG